MSVTVWLGLLGARVVGGFGFCGEFAGGLVIGAYDLVWLGYGRRFP